MKEQAFCYHYVQKSWAPINNSNLIAKDLAHLPIVIVAEDTKNSTTLAWCTEHMCYEGIDEFLEDGLTTTKGCHLVGFIVSIDKDIQQTIRLSTADSASIIICWNVKDTPALSKVIFTYIKADITFLPQAFDDAMLLPIPHLVYINSNDIYLSTDNGKGHIYPNSVPRTVLKYAFPKLKHKFPEEPILYDKDDINIESELVLEKKYYQFTVISGNRNRSYWECNINGFNFRQIHFISAFQNISRTFDCYWYDEQELEDKILFAIENNGRYTGLLQIDGDSIVKLDICDICDESLKHYQELAIYAWLEHTNLIKTNQLNSDISPSDIQNEFFNVKPITRIDKYDNIPLIELLSIPDQERVNGYYTSLYKKINSININRIDTNPCISLLFKAANENNAEAQYILHLIYIDGLLTRKREYFEGIKWLKRAVENGWMQINFDMNYASISNYISCEHVYRVNETLSNNFREIPY